MKHKRILVSWIDYDNIRASLAEDTENCRNLQAELTIETGRYWQPLTGHPLVTQGLIYAFRNQIAIPLRDGGQFEELHLLSTFSEELNAHYKNWLVDERVTIHKVDFYNTDPDPHGITRDMNYKNVYEAAKKILEKVHNAERDLCIYLSPGTRTTEGVWILLGKTTFPAIFFQYWEGFVFEAQIPFDIMIDVVPELLRESDLRITGLGGTDFRDFQGFAGILGKSNALKHAVQKAQAAAIRDVSVLLTGESGTGKELFARAMHRSSPRGRNDPEFNRFVAVNCAAIPADLLESELFGHEKGAYTGASEKTIGAFEHADGGTLFLDEVGELTSQHQAKLLRALQPIGDGPCQRQIRRVGGSEEKPVDVRVVAATNRNIFDAIKAGKFRDDLYYRLAPIRIKLPPLRERRMDIEILCKAILNRLEQQFSQKEPSYRPKVLTPTALKTMREYSWPGNIRELEGVLTQACVFSRSSEIGAADIKSALELPAAGSADNVFARSRGEEFDLNRRLREIKMAFIRDALNDTEDNQSKAAKLLGISQQTISRELLNETL